MGDIILGIACVLILFWAIARAVMPSEDEQRHAVLHFLRSGGQCSGSTLVSLSNGVLPPIMWRLTTRRMERDGLIVSNKVDGARRYRITDAGVAELARIRFAPMGVGDE